VEGKERKDLCRLKKKGGERPDNEETVRKNFPGDQALKGGKVWSRGRMPNSMALNEASGAIPRHQKKTWAILTLRKPGTFNTQKRKIALSGDGLRDPKKMLISAVTPGKTRPHSGGGETLVPEKGKKSAECEKLRRDPEPGEREVLEKKKSVRTYLRMAALPPPTKKRTQSQEDASPVGMGEDETVRIG